MRPHRRVLLAACVGVAAIALQSPPYGAAKQVIARWAPQLVLTSSLPLENPGLPAQPSPPTVQAAAAKAAPPQPAPPAQTTPEDVVPTAAALSPGLTLLLQSMARDLATLGQRIEQLKASQEQMARVIAKVSEAKASEQSLRPKISAPRYGRLPPRRASRCRRASRRRPQRGRKPQRRCGESTVPAHGHGPRRR
jgi:hypothetical protein